MYQTIKHTVAQMYMHTECECILQKSVTQFSKCALLSLYEFCDS